jgi:alpha-methylacyl-CoA racemase
MLDRPLEGIRVIELASVFPGPLAGMWLADLGADVIKVEHPRAGDVARRMGPPPKNGRRDSVTFLVANRGKRSLTLNVARPQGREILLQLLADADVLLESYRPGTTRRLGLDFDTLHARFPRLVYAHLSLHGMVGPYADKLGHDGNAAALTGILSTTGRDRPTLPGVQMADVGGAQVMVSSVLAALFQRERTGTGQLIDGALIDAAFTQMTLLAGHVLAGEPTAFGRGALNGGLPVYQVYATKDEAHVVLCALEERFLQTFLDKAGASELAPKLAAGGAELEQALASLFAGRTLAEWEPVMQSASSCLSPVRSVEQALEDPHLRARGLIQELDHPTEGRLILVGSPYRVGGASAARRPPPRLGEHTQAILQELGFDEGAIAALRDATVA